MRLGRVMVLVLGLSVSVASAAPTPEEQALKAALAGRHGEAVRILEATGDADQRWLAARYAVQSGELGAARRLLAGTDAPPWSRVALLSAQGEHRAAAEAALTLMDEALSGVNRAALTRLMVEWAAERTAIDASSSATFLWAALGLAPTDPLRLEVEDRLLEMPEGRAGGIIVDLAQRRLDVEPDHLIARLRMARPQANTWPAWTLGHLVPVVAMAPRVPALEAATTITGLAVPDPLILDALQTMARRFPEDVDVSKLRLSFATGLMKRDPVAGAAALQALVNDPIIGLDALAAQAAASSDPRARRALWLELARREGASSRGEKARVEALSALLAEVEAQPAGPARRDAAIRALSEPDGHDNSALLYNSLPEGPERAAGLWSQVERFPKGQHWCGELAILLVNTGADDAEASRWSRSCGEASTTDGAILQGQVHGEPTLSLRPRPGRVEARVAATATLKVQQHRVDPETLFFSTSGHPLDMSLEAFLVEPDAAWDLKLDVDHAGVTEIEPRGGGPLFAITARADAARATALVVSQPLDVQVVRLGEHVAVGVLRDGQPVSGAEITLVDERGVVVRGRSDRGGVLRVSTEKTALRIMARRGDGLGFALAATPGEAAARPRPTFAIVPWDRANTRQSQRAPVEIFGTSPTGGADGPLTLRCVHEGQVIDEVPVTLVGGVAHAEPWTLAGSDLILVGPTGETLAETSVGLAPTDAGPLSFEWSDPTPTAGGRIEVRATALRSLPPEGLTTAYEIHSNWNTATDELLLGPEGLRLSQDLRFARPGQLVDLRVSVPHDLSAADITVGSVTIAAPVAPAALSLPGVIDAGQVIQGVAPAGTWLRARSGPLQVWARAEDPLVLPTPGTWQICAWREICGPERAVLAGEPRLGDGDVWMGEPSLAALVTDGIERAVILRRGDRLPSSPRAELSLAWATIFNGPDGAAIQVPLPTPPTPTIEVRGALQRGGASRLTLGADLPPQSRLWAFLRDASDLGTQAAPTPVAKLWGAVPARLGGLWRPHDVKAEPIARALLEEEERRAESGPLTRLDYNFGFGERGSGVGGGGTASGVGGYGAKGRGSGSSGSSPTIMGAMRGGHPASWDGRAIAVATGVRPGDWSVSVPGWVTAADLSVVARLPDGRWTSRAVRVSVGGATPVPRADPPAAEPPSTWDGQPASLLPLALSLPLGAQPPALAALSKAGVSAARAPLQASLAAGDDGLPGELLAREALGLPPGATTTTGGANLPDSNRAARAEAALRLAPGDPERASTMARRLLTEPDLAPWVRVRAGLALWVTGGGGELDALAGDDPTLAAARALVSGEPEARYGGAWWAIASAEAAAPEERALAIAALSQLEGLPPAPASPSRPRGELKVLVEPPRMARRGVTYRRGTFDGPWEPDPALGIGVELPVGRVTSVWVSVPATDFPTRLGCPSSAEVRPEVKWFDIKRSAEAQLVHCDLEGIEPGPVALRVTWYGPDGAPLAEGTAPLTVVAARDGAPTDPMSPRERLGLGVSLSNEGDPAGMDLLARLLATETLPPGVTAEASLARVRGATLLGDPAALVAAVDAWRERAPGGELDLATSAAFAHAAAQTGDPERALAAVSTILDARFKEELGAVSAVRGAGLELTALKLLRTLIARYPEVPTVVSARYLAPSMLLERAEGEGDRLGYTRASLRHSAAGELAGFLLLHGDDAQAPEAAVLLMSALDHLLDPGRSAALAGPLGRAYASSPQGWLLTLSNARALLAAGSPRAALDALAGVSPPMGREREILLTRGQALEALGRPEEALAAYSESDSAEALARAAWLTRSELALPPYVVVRPGDPSTLAVGMRPGAVGTLTATRISLEDALLAHDGQLDPNAFAVSGLGAPTPRRFSADPAGALPLPDLSFGAWLLEVRTEGLLARSVLIHTDAALTVTDSGGASFAHLTDRAGAPLEGATVWLFGPGGGATPARTDAGGATWTPGPTAGALARIGDRYAWWQTQEGATAQGSPAASPARPTGDALRRASEGYGELFQQQQGQKVKASGL